MDDNRWVIILGGIGMKKYSLFTFILFFCFCAQGQDTVTYKFSDINELRYGGNEIWFAKSFDHQIIYIKNNIFKEPSGLFDAKPCKFKIQNGCWYIKKTGRWQLFYSPNETVTPKLKIYYSSGDKSWWFNLKAHRTDTIYGHHCIIYYLEPIIKVIRVNENTIDKRGIDVNLGSYWFNPELGIIRIDTGEHTYIREDIYPATNAVKSKKEGLN